MSCVIVMVVDEEDLGLGFCNPLLYNCRVFQYIFSWAGCTLCYIWLRKRRGNTCRCIYSNHCSRILGVYSAGAASRERV